MRGNDWMKAGARAVVMVAGLAASCLAATARAQDVGVIYAEVTDGNGVPVTDLRAEEFRVVEDEQVAEVVTAQLGAEPMRVALLVDNGVIIGRRQALGPLRDGVAGFLETLPPQHAVSLSTIGGHIGWRVDFTTDRAALLASAREMHSDSGSVRFLDGIRETWDRRFDGDEAWPVFVAILTDANETSAFMSENRFNRFVDNLRAAGVMVHTVLWASRVRQTTPSLVSTGLALHLAGNTGGRYVGIATATAYGQALRQLAADIAAHHDAFSKRYRLLYELPDDRGTRTSVSVLRPGLNVRLFGDRRMDP